MRGLRARGAAVELPATGLGEAQELAFYHEANSAATGGAAAGSADAADVSDEDAEAAQAALAALQAAEAAALAAGAPPCTSADVDAALEALATAAQAVPAGGWPPPLGGGALDPPGLDGPGLHSWWVDKDGAAQLSRGLGLTLPPGRLYVGQAGATKWPAGRTRTHHSRPADLRDPPRRARAAVRPQVLAGRGAPRRAGPAGAIAHARHAGLRGRARRVDEAASGCGGPSRYRPGHSREPRTPPPDPASTRHLACRTCHRARCARVLSSCAAASAGIDGRLTSSRAGPSRRGPGEAAGVPLPGAWKTGTRRYKE